MLNYWHFRAPHMCSLCDASFSPLSTRCSFNPSFATTLLPSIAPRNKHHQTPWSHSPRPIININIMSTDHTKTNTRGFKSADEVVHYVWRIRGFLAQWDAAVVKSAELGWRIRHC